MSASLRFLAMAVVGWAGVRAATLGALPGTEAFTLGRDEAAPRAVAAAESRRSSRPNFRRSSRSAETDAVAGRRGRDARRPAAHPPPGAMPPFRSIIYPVGVPAERPYVQASLPAPRRGRLTPIAPEPAAVFYAPIPQLDEWPLSRMASAAMPARRSATTAGAAEPPAGRAEGARSTGCSCRPGRCCAGSPGPSSLATGGTLGGSQAGARLTYTIIAAARGVAAQQLAGRRRARRRARGRRSGHPVPLDPDLADRRAAAGDRPARRRPLGLCPVPRGRRLPAADAVGVRARRLRPGRAWSAPGSRDLFADGGCTLTRPLFGRFSAGFGMWGGVQPGLYRVDAGPRVTMRVRGNMRVHLDYRQRVAGNAEPGSGPAVTLAADFLRPAAQSPPAVSLALAALCG